MTEKQMNKLADIVAKKVINELEEKQKQWDQELNENVSEFFTQDSTHDVKFLSEEEFIENQIKELKQLLVKTIEKEDYEYASKINAKIEQLKEKLK